MLEKMEKTMADAQIVENLFDSNADITGQTLDSFVDNALVGMDDGELFQEYSVSENLVFDDGTLKSSSSDIMTGFGLRAVLGEATAYAHSTTFNKDALQRAANTVTSLKLGHEGTVALRETPHKPHQPLYLPHNPIDEFSFAQKIDILKEIDAYLRAKDPRVKQVSASIGGEMQVVRIIRKDGFRAQDIRPLVRLNVSVVVEENGRKETGGYGGGGRVSYASYFAPQGWKDFADKALHQALTNLKARPATAGEMDVILAPGWPGIILHEAIGHGLEGDYNRKGTSAFAGLMGKQIASKGVTVVDDGTLSDRRGSLTIDDEGTPTQCTTLIDDGILVGYMHDRHNAHLMGHKPTGNGRRESYEYQPMPRMTNTYMLGSDGTFNDMLSSMKDGIYAVSFGGGQVDITSGKFVFSASEAYKVENGEIKYPVKGITLIGNGPDVLTKIKAVGNDMKLDPGIGTCGKDGQGVPVGVGQPSMLISGLTIGGTEVE